MNDRNIDIELIMALAEESLPADEAIAAEASLDEAARIELASQRAARTAMADIGTATMSTTERADLHEALRDELHLVEPSSDSAAVSPSHSPWHARALPALGALAAVVIVVGIGINSIGFGGSDSVSTSDFETALAPPSAQATGATTAATMSATMSVTTSAATTQLSGAADSDDATEAMAEAALTTEAAADGGPDIFNRIMMLPHNLGAISLTDEAGIYSAIDDGAIEIAEYTPYPAFSLNRTAAEPGLVCWSFVTDNVGPETEIDYLGIATVDGEPGEVYRTLEPDGEGVIYLIVVADCEPVGVLPR